MCARLSARGHDGRAPCGCRKVASVTRGVHHVVHSARNQTSRQCACGDKLDGCVVGNCSDKRHHTGACNCNRDYGCAITCCSVPVVDTATARAKDQVFTKVRLAPQTHRISTCGTHTPSARTPSASAPTSERNGIFRASVNLVEGIHTCAATRTRGRSRTGDKNVIRTRSTARTNQGNQETTCEHNTVDCGGVVEVNVIVNRIAASGISHTHSCVRYTVNRSVSCGVRCERVSTQRMHKVVRG